MNEIRSEILKHLEKNSKADLGELAILLGTDEISVANRRHGERRDYLWLPYTDRLGQSRKRFCECIDRSSRDPAERAWI